MYTTNCFRNDGFGAQYQTIIYSAIFSEIIKTKFAYTPFKEIEHNYNNDPNFLNKKENFINLIEHFPNALTLDNVQILNYQVVRQSIERDLNASCQTDTFKYIKTLFHNNKISKFDKNFQNIAIHLRRINSHDNPDCYGTHYISDEYYINAIRNIRKLGQKQLFHIYSQGNANEFNNFQEEDIVLHLNEPLEETFYDLTTADVLVMSKSSFSYVAALLSNNEIYYLPFWHPKLNNWKIF